MKVLQAIVTMPERQRETVERLVAWCRKLDGTKLKVVPISAAQDAAFKPAYVSNGYCCLQAYGFHLGALAAEGKSFIYLEADSTPFRPGWAKALTDEYQKHGKPFLLPDMTGLSRFDIASGIGVYPGFASSIVPIHYPRHSFDKWLVDHLSDSIARTRLIQHSYGNYHPRIDKCEPHRFPRDRAMLHPEAMIFHRDKFQDLIGCSPDTITSMEKTFYHTGCLGDIIAGLPIMRQLGGGHLVIGNHLPGPGMKDGGRPMEGPRYASIEPLLASLDYIKSVRFQHGFKADHDFSTFRKVYRPFQTLTASQGSWLGLKSVNIKPWISVEKDPTTTGMIAISRTSRYHNPQFPWKQLAARHGHRMVFLGYEEEYQSFIAEHGDSRIHFSPTTDLLQMARLIAGSSLFIGNQSVHCWIAMAMGHPLIQETWHVHPDSMIQRPNARFVKDGSRRDFAAMGVPL